MARGRRLRAGASRRHLRSAEQFPGGAHPNGVLHWPSHRADPDQRPAVRPGDGGGADRGSGPVRAGPGQRCGRGRRRRVRGRRLRGQRRGHGAVHGRGRHRRRLRPGARPAGRLLGLRLRRPEPQPAPGSRARAPRQRQGHPGLRLGGGRGPPVHPGAGQHRPRPGTGRDTGQHHAPARIRRPPGHRPDAGADPGAAPGRRRQPSAAPGARPGGGRHGSGGHGRRRYGCRGYGLGRAGQRRGARARGLGLGGGRHRRDPGRGDAAPPDPNPPGASR